MGEVCALAAGDYGLTGLRAAAALANVGSRTVLTRNGFVATCIEVTLDGKPGLWYLRELAGGGSEPASPPGRA